MEKHLHELIDGALAFVGGLVPGAIGAGVGIAFEKGLSWSARFLQLAVGTTVSYFTVGLLGMLVTLNEYALQGAGFWLGMIAYKATPRIIASAADVAASLPGRVRDRFLPGDQK